MTFDLESSEMADSRSRRQELAESEVQSMCNQKRGAKNQRREQSNSGRLGIRVETTINQTQMADTEHRAARIKRKPH